jgi:hypothetical protein
MKKLFSGFVATALAATFAVAGAVPLQAAPLFVPKTAQATEGAVVDIQYRDWRRHNRIDRRLDRMARRDFYRNGNIYYYNGYRGFRGHRHGYREYNGWWFPAAAFVAGALLTGSVRASSANDHEAWCYNRYRSYRAWDNTFQPYNGPRRQCYSPFD